MKKNKRLLTVNIFVIVIAVIYIFIMMMNNVFVVKTSVATVEGSYGQEFALTNKLNQVTLADSEQLYFDQRYEEFDFNIANGKITLEEYSGKSEELIIPASIEGYTVTTLGNNFLESLSSVKTIYLPSTVVEVLGEQNNSIRIYCSEDSDLLENDEYKEWTLETYYDSDFKNFLLGDLPFEYNMNGESIEITRYNGNEELVVIPSYINGYPVTSVSFDFLTTSDIFVIPETVIEISGRVSETIYSTVFMIELIFTVLAVVIALIIANVLLPRYQKNNEEYHLTGNQMVAIMLYVVLQTAFGLITTYLVKVSPTVAMVTSLIILAVFIAIVLMAGKGREHVQTVDAKIGERTSRMKAIKNTAKNMASEVKNPELRKMVQRLEDEIRYSDSVTREELDIMESKIEEAVFNIKKAIAENDEEKIRNLTESTMKCVKERNVMCKAGK